ncbi:MAG: Crp/Fnr family transcriptional regulator [Dehalococcoidales bacterium]|nr:Crp/Fnr family transcriptional regulator [Dehalococcoidales bacterium]
MPIPDGFLESLPYFSKLSNEQMERVREGSVELSFPRSEIVFLEGEPCEGLYVVKSGQLRIFKSSPEGREQVLLIARPGDIFNDVPVFDGGANPASASALEDSTAYLIPKDRMLSLLNDCPAALNVIRQFATRLRSMTVLVEDLSFRSVVSRLAKVLLDLAVVEGGPSPVRRLTQDEMAAMIGTVRDVVGRGLRTLEKKGGIKMEGQRILIVDPRILRGML